MDDMNSLEARLKRSLMIATAVHSIIIEEITAAITEKREVSPLAAEYLSHACAFFITDYDMRGPIRDRA